MNIRKNNIKGWGGNKVNWKKIYSDAGKVVSALVSITCLSFTIVKKDEYLEINIIQLVRSPYTYIRVYDNIVIYCGDDLHFEGMALRKSTIIKDILAK